MEITEDLGNICTTCANERNLKWPKGHVATFHIGTCPYCDQARSLCSTGDYDWPDGKARGMRD